MNTQKFPYRMRLPIRTMTDVRMCLAEWVLTIGLGFHVDTQGSDYQDSNEKRTFTESQAKIYDTSIRQCREICGDCSFDVYSIAQDIYHTILLK